ncbi:MAG: hypothetical protein KAU14_01440 [Thermoplasmata archaeon]|nr:hypothetical protein [Thermoplasmata archaeon]
MEDEMMAGKCFGLKGLNTTSGDKQTMKTEIDYQWCLTVNQHKPTRRESHNER